jgi:hypothetical protein
LVVSSLNRQTDFAISLMLPLALLSAKPAQKRCMSNSGAAACAPPESMMAMATIKPRVIVRLNNASRFKSISPHREKLL